MPSNMLEIRPVSGAVGAEIHGIDLAEPILDETLSTIRHALADRGVVFFRDQLLTPEQQITFARRFGNINVNRFFAHADGYPEIALVVKEPHQTKNIGGGWHTDHSYDREPALGSILYAREVPRLGGDTLFASMYAAYDGSSGGLKQTLEGLRARHSSRHVFGVERDDLKGRIGNPEFATQDAIHPVVITHPESSRKAPATQC
jgi:taurine dioxygenase